MSALRTERLISAGPRKIFEAFEKPEVLAQWWGPSGFKNTFNQFEFKNGGRWAFVMHGPNGVDYPNESTFSEIIPDSKIVIRHDKLPLFTLTITLTPKGDKTLLTWVQAFDKPEVAEQLRKICEPANEQNLDKLESVLK